MTVLELIKTLADFSLEDLKQVRDYIQAREQVLNLRAGTVDMEVLLKGLELIREGMSDEEFAEIERAMNDEYIEAVDFEG